MRFVQGLMLASLAFVLHGVGYAAEKEITARGKVVLGSLDSGLEDANGDGPGFMTNSDVARKILAVCKSGDVCEVAGKVNDSNGMLVSVSRVRKIDPNSPPDASRAGICSEAKTRSGAKRAIENGYVNFGLSIRAADGYMKVLPNLVEFTGDESDAIRRNAAQKLKIKFDDVKVCRAEIAPNTASYLVIFVLRHPREGYGYIASNIGHPQMVGLDGWVQE